MISNRYVAILLTERSAPFVRSVPLKTEAVVFFLLAE